jgi:hypothetical protein
MFRIRALALMLATASVGMASSTDWDRNRPTLADFVFSDLKRYLASTIDVGLPCGPAYQGCEGYCTYVQDFERGQVVVETTTKGWIFYRRLFDSAGFTDGQRQWLRRGPARPPLILGAPYWFCDVTGLTQKLGIAACR